MKFSWFNISHQVERVYLYMYTLWLDPELHYTISHWSEAVTKLHYIVLIGQRLSLNRTLESIIKISFAAFELPKPGTVILEYNKERLHKPIIYHGGFLSPYQLVI